jgi:hypothetical protein
VHYDIHRKSWRVEGYSADRRRSHGLNER